MALNERPDDSLAYADVAEGEDNDNMIIIHPDEWWHTHVSVLRIIDSDTLLCRFDRGFNDFSDKRIRLLGLNGPEKDTAAHQSAVDWIQERLDVRKNAICIRTLKPDSPDKYGGRWNGIVYVWDDEGKLYSLNEAMVEAGLAKPWSGKGAKPA